MMTSLEAFRVRLFAPGTVLTCDQHAGRVNGARSQIVTILQPFFGLERLRFELPNDGEGWMVVLVEQSRQMMLEFEIKAQLEAQQRRDAKWIAEKFREHCLGLIDVIRNARLDRHALESLYMQANEAHDELKRVCRRLDSSAVVLEITATQIDGFHTKIPDPPSRVYEVNELVALNFQVLSVARDYAEVELDRASRLTLANGRRSRALLSGILEEQLNQSIFLHRKMLEQAPIQATGAPIMGSNGRAIGFRLHEVSLCQSKTDI